MLVDGLIAGRKISDCLTVVARSSAAGQVALGVFVRRATASPDNPPASMRDDAGAAVGSWAGWCDTHDLAIVNAVGEGSINVCGQAGDIAQGDLIVVSDTAGKGMKQADDVLGASTIAQAREAVTFASPDEVTQIACIYL